MKMGANQLFKLGSAITNNGSNQERIQKATKESNLPASYKHCNKNLNLQAEIKPTVHREGYKLKN